MSEGYVYYVCEKCGEDFMIELEEDKEARKTLQCPFCGSLAAFLCKDVNEVVTAIDAVKMRNDISERINRMKGGDFS